MVVASEVGVMDFEPSDVVSKGRLQPGKILLIDTQEGKIYYDGEIKEQLAKAHPYREWLNENRVQLEKLKSGRKVDNSVSNLAGKLVTFGFGQEDIDKTIIPMWQRWVTTPRWLSSQIVRRCCSTTSVSSLRRLRTLPSTPSAKSW